VRRTSDVRRGGGFALARAEQKRINSSLEATGTVGEGGPFPGEVRWGSFSRIHMQHNKQIKGIKQLISVFAVKAPKNPK